ncbi:uncharacterized protein LOC111467730 isoform X1 [Cucurbita maxima]|uniref:Uncharacterized protein LOC111467730 isoform X1 n=1 Tax=Cucurbita maxima TaxID=3661 RepID=A0A6J1HYA0_CUCMA|nr:uncharacterized protein LOC111467730 isoform X1 [Cucurbita maxima]
MADPRASLSSLSSPPSLPPNDQLPRRFKVVWRVLLISNFALSAYMFASARKKDLGQMESDEAEKDLGQLENDGIEKCSDSEIMEIPSTFMVDTTGIVTENIPEDQHQKPFHWIVDGWREKTGSSKK